MLVKPILLSPLGVYAALAAAFFAATGPRTRDLTVAASATFVAATMHLAYGLGTCSGSWRCQAGPGLRAAMERISR